MTAPKRTIRTKFLGMLVPGVLVAFVLVSIAFAFVTALELHDELEERQSAVSMSLAGALVGPMWNFDDDMVRGTLEAAALDPAVASVVVLSTDGGVVAETGTRGDDGHLTVRRPIVHEGMAGPYNLGTLEMTFTDAHVTERIKSMLVRDGMLLVLLVLMTVATAVAANRTIVVRPLQRLVEEIRHHEKTGHPEPVERHGDDEIGTVIEAYNALAEALGTERGRLEAAVAEAHRANANKSRFLAAASHDLRQPLHAMSLFCGVLDSTLRRSGATDSDASVVATHNIRKSVDLLGGLLGTLLDISKLDADAVHPEFGRFPVGDVLSGAVDDFRDRAREAGIDLRRVPCSTTVESDPLLLRQIVGNLVSNAVRHTEDGRVLVGCRRRGRRLVIEVWDTGPGIPPDRLDEIFEEFRQIDNPARQSEKGFGLGLAIVRRTAALLGHEVAVRSVPGKGSVFSVAVPEAVSGPVETAAAAARPAAPPRPAASVLLIEDEDAVVRATTALLDEWGYGFLAARSADEALAVYDAVDPKPDLVIVDYQLPGGNGLDVYRRIAARHAGRLAGILVSGTTLPADLDEFDRSGLRHLGKPVDPVDLEEAIRDALTDRSSPVTRPAA